MEGCTSAVQAERDIVNRSEAEAAFEDDDFNHAASLWGRMRSSEPSFEEIALRFVEVGATEALQVFLMARLHVLGPDDKAQVQEQRNSKCKPAVPALLTILHRKCVLSCNSIMAMAYLVFILELSMCHGTHGCSSLFIGGLGI